MASPHLIPAAHPTERLVGQAPAHCHLGLGTLYAEIGRREQAHAAMDMTFWLPQAEAALTQVE